MNILGGLLGIGVNESNGANVAGTGGYGSHTVMISNGSVVGINISNGGAGYGGGQAGYGVPGSPGYTQVKTREETIKELCDANLVV